MALSPVLEVADQDMIARLLWQWFLSDKRDDHSLDLLCVLTALLHPAQVALKLMGV